MNANEIIDSYLAQRGNAADAIEALHPFTVSRVARFCNDERDLEYIRRSANPVYLFGDALAAPPSKVPPKEKAAIWLDYIRCAEIDDYLARLVSKKVPGCEAFRNLSPDCFHGRIHVTGFAPNAKRADARTGVEPFLRGETSDSASVIAFLKAARKDASLFPVREMFLYACAHCASVERFAYILGQLRPQLGRTDFVDVFGYSPFFYAAFARVRDDEEEFGRWLAHGKGRAFCDLIRKAGARPNRKCRYGFSWMDLEAAALERFAENTADSGSAEATTGRGDGWAPFTPTIVPEPLPVPSSASELRQILLGDPDRGVAALLAMDYAPASLEKPFGPRERLLSDAICDRSIPKPTRARLLRLCDGQVFAGLPPSEAEDVPIGFLDSASGRRWMCENGRPGCETIRCSHPTFFKNVLPVNILGYADAVTAKLDPEVKKALSADSPAQLMMRLSVMGKGMDTRMLCIVLGLLRTKILEWLLENDEKTRPLLDSRRMLFYVCANWHETEAVAWLEKAEAAQPGILKSCVDALGRNLLWYSHYRRRRVNPKLADMLLAHGCDPDAETIWGLSWRDLREASTTAGFELTLNGKAPSAVLSQDGAWNDKPKEHAERIETVRVFMPGTGRTFEWKCAAKGRGCVLTRWSIGARPVPKFALELKQGWRQNAEVRFELGADGIFHIRSKG